jgi:transcriptional regulator with XRE-family HTH domain
MSFGDELKRLRQSSRYPDMSDFARYAGVVPDQYRDYERGKRIPNKETLEKLIFGGGLSDEDATVLREARNVERARQCGVDLSPPGSLHIDVPALAESIQKEIEFELKRSQVTVSSRKWRVIARRIEILLKNALGEP